jgi:hypothetical protein
VEAKVGKVKRTVERSRQYEEELAVAERIASEMDNEGPQLSRITPIVIGAALWVLVGFIYFIIWSD